MKVFMAVVGIVGVSIYAVFMGGVAVFLVMVVLDLLHLGQEPLALFVGIAGAAIIGLMVHDWCRMLDDIRGSTKPAGDACRDTRRSKSG